MIENKEMIGRKVMKIKQLCEIFYDYKKDLVKILNYILIYKWEIILK